jgi:hypothetical protein
MQNDNERTSLLEKLTDKTLAGKIAWKSTYEPGTFIASVEGEFGLELSRPSNQMFIYMKMFDTAGNQFYSTSEAAPTTSLTLNHRFFKLKRLYDLAKEKAFDKSEIVQQLARAEKVLDAL